MGDKVLLLTKHLNVTSDRELVPHFVDPFPLYSGLDL